MKENEKEPVDLPENAFRELEPGEEYHPIMSPDRNYREVTPWSVSWGIVMAILFSAAAAYLGLKVGQVFEAAIPIAIIAVGLSSAFKRKNGLGENVIIQSIGACSGTVVAGVIFTLPALYIIPGLSAGFLQVFLSSLLGGVLGYSLLDTVPQHFRVGYARQVSFPRSNSHYSDSCFGPERRKLRPVCLFLPDW